MKKHFWRISNGAHLTISTIDNGLRFTLTEFLPHGIFEIPAILVTRALGISVFLSIFKSGNIFHNILTAFKNSGYFFVFVILPLLFVAALIEAVGIMLLWF